MNIRLHATAVATILAFSMLTACGGGGGGDSAASTTEIGSHTSQGNSPTQTPTQPTQPSTQQPAPTSGSSSDSDSASGSPEQQAFSASLVRAPVDGEQISGIVRLEVSGSGIANVELLPQSGYTPRLGVFNVNTEGTSAWLDFDTTTVPNGTLTVRINAFDGAAGSSGASEQAVMQPRTWRLQNDPPPFGSQAGRAARCQMMGLPYTPVDDAQPVVCVEWALPSPPVPPEQCTTKLDTPYSNPEDRLPVLRDGRRISK
ncbi:MAG TPA: hypothetical protein VIG66_08470, partial [Noviherbaspirillum sp.]